MLKTEAICVDDLAKEILSNKKIIDDMFDETVTAIGMTDGGMNVYGIARLLPFLCFINAPECRRLGIHYYDPDRAWALMTGKVQNGKHYDTGASFLEDIRRAKVRLKMVVIKGSVPDFLLLFGTFDFGAAE